MKHLLTGAAMAAALAIAAPVWAQTAPMTPSSPPKAAPAAPAATTPMAKKPMAKMPMKKHMAMHKGMMSQGDKMTEDLNQQELARIQGGNTTAMPVPAPAAPAPGMGAPPPPK
jgi:hypothetical protein